MPRAVHSLPAKRTSFSSNQAKIDYVSKVMEITNKAQVLADTEYSKGFRFKEAYVEYMVSAEGISILKEVARDDQNFIAQILPRFEYCFGRAKICKAQFAFKVGH